MDLPPLPKASDTRDDAMTASDAASSSHEAAAHHRRPWWRTLPLICAAVLALVLPVVVMVGGFDLLREWAHWLRADGLWLLPGYVVVTAVLIGLAVLPSHATNVLTGFVYGLTYGVPAALLAVTLGAGVGHTVGRRVSSDDLRRLVDRRPTGRALLHAMVDTSPSRSTFAVILARLGPQVPFALGNLLAAAVGVRLMPFMLGTLVGMLPRVVVGVWVGAQLRTFELGRSSPMVIVLGLATGIIGLTLIGWWAYRVVKRMQTQ